MAVASPARTVALRLLGRQRRRGARARDLLRTAHEMGSLGTRGRALVTRLVLGVNVASGELDQRIDALLTRSGGLEPRVRDAMRLSALELLYLDTPRQVAVSQGVELVRSVQPRAARMANAVLRRVAEGRDEVDAARRAVEAAAAGAGVGGSGAASVSGAEAPGTGAPTPDQLRIASGYPAWLCERLLADLGPRAAAGLCACALEPAPVYAAAGRALDVAELEARLHEAGLDPEATGLPRSWRLRASAALASSGLVGTCDVATADLAAQIVCRIAAGAEGRLLEIGQGRGTKSLLLAGIARELAGREGALHISACDSVASKVRISAERMEVAGLSDAVTCTAFDATKLADSAGLPKALAGAFEAAFVDAPCSGTGTMRRHPEIPWALEEASLDPAQPDSLPALQLRLLTAAAARVAPGGSLAYATCSVLPVENEGVVEAFLASGAGADFSRSDVLEAPGVATLSPEGRALVAAGRTGTGSFQSVPRAGSFDGHFCCRLVRRA